MLKKIELNSSKSVNIHTLINTLNKIIDYINNFKDCNFQKISKLEQAREIDLRQHSKDYNISNVKFDRSYRADLIDKKIELYEDYIAELHTLIDNLRADHLKDASIIRNLIQNKS